MISAEEMQTLRNRLDRMIAKSTIGTTQHIACLAVRDAVEAMWNESTDMLDDVISGLKKTGNSGSLWD